jgi:hypothetical protein
MSTRPAEKLFLCGPDIEQRKLGFDPEIAVVENHPRPIFSVGGHHEAIEKLGRWSG